MAILLYVVYPEKWDSYVKFTLVRNPLDRFVSAYHYTKMEKSYWHDNVNRIASHPDYELMSKRTLEECCEILKNSSITTLEEFLEHAIKERL